LIKGPCHSHSTLSIDIIKAVQRFSKFVVLGVAGSLCSRFHPATWGLTTPSTYQNP
jgi:hypothetical protein